MGKKLSRLPKATLVLGAATMTLVCLPYPTRAQSSAPEDRQAVQSDEVTHRDLARFDQFLDNHHEIAGQLRKTPSLVNDPQFLQSHPELNAYLQDHPSVKQEISERPDTFMRLEDSYGLDTNLRHHDAGMEDRDAGRGDMANRDDRRDDHRDVASFDRFLDEHREIAQQVRKDPSLLDNQRFVQSHAALQTYLQENPGVRDQIRQDPSAFMRQEDAYSRDSNMRDRDPGADRDRRDVASFDRFLDGHREIAEQVRKNPSLLDNRDFVKNHPALQAYLEQNPGVRDQLRQDPNSFMRQEEARDSNRGDRDPMHDHMADFGGFLRSHNDVRIDLSKNPSVVKDHEYVQNHTELDAYLNAHPDVRAELMANPQSFVHGSQHYTSPSGVSTGAGAGVTGHGTMGTTGSMTGTGATGTSMTPATTPHEPAK